jgi:serine/threonine protein kinase
MDHHRKLPPWQKPSHLPPPPQWTLETSIPIEGETSVLQNELQETRIVARTSPSDSNQTNETTKTNIQLQQQQRSMEVTAIRSILEQHEQEQLLQKQKKSKQRPRSGPVSPPQQTNHHHPKPLSWSVEEHPLSLSRYQREFEQIGLLNTGAFGQVYEAKSKMDGREYAIKRVPFAASGYSRDSVQRVVREVHCLAVCDHPHVVRYYTSWLEPSWMTGSTAAGDLDHRHQVTRSSSYLKLLTDVEQLVSTGKESEILSDDLREYFKDRIFGTTRRKSVDDMLLDAPWDDFADEVDADDEYSEWTVDACKDDIFIRGYRSRRRCGGSFQGRISAENENGSFVFDSWRRQQQKRRTRQQPDRPHYNYQICLFIQMQLCHPATLADWIRARNENMSHQSLGDRLDTAAEVFGQIASGLSHVHARGIVHRDLKPANVFASADGLHFKIGDFGLSKMIENASSTSPQRQRRSGIYHREQQLLLLGNGIVQEQEHDNKFPSVRNPLTAGVGTASYAAPEQVATSTYGTQADIFSLGLIFLEMLCCFSTEHERLQTFQDCRNRRVVPQELKLFPAAVELILACTDPNPEKRPTAQNLCSVKLKKSSCNDDADVEGNREEALRLELLAKERELSEYKEILQLKDQIIQEQQMRIESLQKEASKKTQVESAQCFKKIHHEDASEPRYLHGDSSSEDDI